MEDLVRLIDHIRTGRRPISQRGAAFLDAGHFASEEARLQAFLDPYANPQPIPVIIADNIDGFVQTFGSPDDGSGHLNPEDLPNLAPPFPTYWYEWRVTDPTLRANGLRIVGSLVQCHRIEQAVEAAMQDPRTDPKLIAAAKAANTPVNQQSGWFVTSLQFVLLADKTICHIIHSPAVMIDSQGMLFDIKMLTSTFAKHLIPGDQEHWRRVAGAILTPALIGMCFLNCKNVSLKDREPNRELSHAHNKRYGKYLTKYKVIDIWPMSKILDAAAEREPNGKLSKIKAMHIVRGHFKRYTEDSKLFGKHQGTYFWSSIVRGTGAAGEIEKTNYRIRLDGKKK